jgi:hypothetical protein
MDDPREAYRVTVNDALEKLELYERTPGVSYGLDQATGRRYHIDAFALEMSWRMANRQRARTEDERILELSRQDSDVLLHPGNPFGR